MNNKYFDVVLGNPPYQRSDSKTHKLWIDLLYRAVELSNSKILFIAPASIFYGGGSNVKDIREFVIPHLSYVDFSINRYFDIGEYICWYDIDLSGDINSKIIVKQKDGTFIQQDRTEKIIDSPERAIELSIIDKIENSEHPRLKLYSDYPNSGTKSSAKYLLDSGIIQEKETPKFCYKFLHSGNQIYYTATPPKFSGWKVAINFSSSFHDMKVTRAVLGKQVEGVQVASEEEGEKIIQALTRKIFLFYIQAEKTGGFNTGIFKLPELDFSRSWTDNQLYKHFNLTDEEIRYIEATIK